MGKDKADNAGFNELLRKGRANGILIEEISGRQVKEIESRANTYERGLFSPATPMGNPTLMLGAIQKGAVIEGVRMHCGVRYLRSSIRCVTTTQSAYHAGYVVNAFGLEADCIVLDYGFTDRHRILLSKRLYFYSSEPFGSIRMSINPPPDLKNPFLGGQLTVAETWNSSQTCRCQKSEA